MSKSSDTFFTSIGCMDGRAQGPIAEFGREKFNAEHPDTITEAGLDGLLAGPVDQVLYDSLKKKLLISIEKHHSRGIVVHGHEDCAGNLVGKEQHIQDIKKSVQEINNMLKGYELPVVGAYIALYPEVAIEELTSG